MSVRAKFKVEEITRRKHWDKEKGEIQTIKLQPVTSGSEENKAFYAVTARRSALGGSRENCLRMEVRRGR